MNDGKVSIQTDANQHHRAQVETESPQKLTNLAQDISAVPADGNPPENLDWHHKESHH